MAIGHIFFCYILFFSFHANKPFAYGATVVEKNKSRAPSSTFSGPARGLTIVHRYGPCSAFNQKKSPSASSQILLKDKLRVQVFSSITQNRLAGVGKEVTAPLLNNLVSAGNFHVTVGFGTPIKYFNLILDTGSFVTWVNCQRCLGVPCPEQNNSLYYPSSSSTSSYAPCWPSCDYYQQYLDGSNSNGSFVRDTLIIQPPDVTSNFVFLCAQNHSKGFGEADGILALGQGSTSPDEKYGNYSLISQTATQFEKVFCHCLPPNENTKGYLYFGKEALEKCQNSGTYTPLLSNPTDPSLYYVNLTAITIGQKRLEISSAVSSPSSLSPSTIIDSGTVITRLPSSVYSALRYEFKELMSKYLPAPPDEFLDTCYNLTGYDNLTIPNMVLHFENLDVNLDQTAVAWKGKGQSQVCLAFAGNRKENDLTIIGNHQQQKLNVLYNIQNKRIEIGPGNC